MPSRRIERLLLAECLAAAPLGLQSMFAFQRFNLTIKKQNTCPHYKCSQRMMVACLWGSPLSALGEEKRGLKLLSGSPLGPRPHEVSACAQGRASGKEIKGTHTILSGLLVSRNFLFTAIESVTVMSHPERPVMPRLLLSPESSASPSDQPTWTTRKLLTLDFRGLLVFALPSPP